MTFLKKYVIIIQKSGDLWIYFMDLHPIKLSGWVGSGCQPWIYCNDTLCLFEKENVVVSKTRHHNFNLKIRAVLLQIFGWNFGGMFLRRKIIKFLPRSRNSWNLTHPNKKLLLTDFDENSVWKTSLTFFILYISGVFLKPQLNNRYLRIYLI